MEKIKKTQSVSVLVCFYYRVNRLLFGKNFFVPAVKCHRSSQPFSIRLSGWFWPAYTFRLAGGGLLAAGAAYVIGKVALGLRSDYLAIATLGISEIILYFLKNEEWLTRGVKNVNGLPRPVPYEVNLQEMLWFQELASDWGMAITEASSLFVKAMLRGSLYRCCDNFDVPF